ncbi:putative Beta-hexosaminidase subunit A1 [Paratrimastix pyriformis]|uniref:beta-N-acetylhexosaminidase n=1 Tax=Paratrimastix pyriformis TaxID=342808 RepID=A0ABQ8UIR0_9EUKA|nr:putative Beta-hexosaminidase subunit A1 [Paratrimastix pyriformis]
MWKSRDLFAPQIPSDAGSAAVMSTVLLLLCLFGLGLCSVKTLWPLPTTVQVGGQEVLVSNFTCLQTNVQSDVIAEACDRYNRWIFPVAATNFKLLDSSNAIGQVAINVQSNDFNLQLGIDESYSLAITTSGVKINAGTIYGALHALETLSQCIDYDPARHVYAAQTVTINDSPRYPWRGLLVDTARHFLPLSFLKSHMVEALAMNKLNTMHWHIVDAQSWDIADLVEYARRRGVRVVPEIDVPGHSYAIGQGYPDLVAHCPSYEANVNNIPVDPTKNATYEMLRAVIGGLVAVCPDKTFHTGGDELVRGCWSQDATIMKWCSDHGIASTNALEGYFEQNLQRMLHGEMGRTMVVWEEPWLEKSSGRTSRCGRDNPSSNLGAPKFLFSLISIFFAHLRHPHPRQAVTLDQGVIVEAWRSIDVLHQIVASGHPGILEPPACRTPHLQNPHAEPPPAEPPPAEPRLQNPRLQNPRLQNPRLQNPACRTPRHHHPTPAFPTSPNRGVFTSQLVRYVTICNNFHDFKEATQSSPHAWSREGIPFGSWHEPGTRSFAVAGKQTNSGPGSSEAGSVALSVARRTEVGSTCSIRSGRHRSPPKPPSEERLGPAEDVSQDRLSQVKDASRLVALCDEALRQTEHAEPEASPETPIDPTICPVYIVPRSPPPTLIPDVNALTHLHASLCVKDFYAADPEVGSSGRVPEANANLILGGEACMWAEQVDEASFDERVWPRAGATAERLWSPVAATSDLKAAAPRLDMMSCRMKRRGIHSGPIIPGTYCPVY